MERTQGLAKQLRAEIPAVPSTICETVDKSPNQSESRISPSERQGAYHLPPGSGEDLQVGKYLAQGREGQGSS